MSDRCLVESVNQAVKENPNCVYNVESFLRKVSDKFIQNKLDDFPRMCLEARKINHEKQKIFFEIGNAGGWSENKDFKFEYEIPRDLYLFMINLVYKDFWSNENAKIWRNFMKSIMRGDDAMDLLVKVKSYYGSNQDVSLT